MASGATKLWRAIFGGADEAAPAIKAARYADLSKTDRSEFMDIALKEARETYSDSRTGLLRRPTADRGDLKGAARTAIEDEAKARGITLRPSDITQITAKAATVAEKGGTLYRGLSTTGGIVGKSLLSAPVAGTVALGGLGYYAFNKAAEGLGGLQDMAASLAGMAPGLGNESGGVSGIFNKVSGGLEYLGMAPWAADIITAFGAFGAIRGAMFAVESATGLNKIPGVGLLTTIAAIAITANMAFNGDAEPDVTARYDRAMAPAGITAPAPAMP